MRHFKVLIYCVFVLSGIFLPNSACIKYYDDDFSEDVFSLPSNWYKILSNNDQVFVNSDKELEIIFHNEKYSGAGYKFPFYASNGIYTFTIFARAEKHAGHIFLYGYKNDYMSGLILGEKLLPVSERYEEYIFNIKLPEEDYNIDLFFTKDDINSNEGRLLVKNVKIYYKLLNFTSEKFSIKNENNCCIPLHRKWKRWQASEKQAFINSDNVMEMRFDERKWITAYYNMPFYKKDCKIILNFTAKALKQNGRLQVYDYTARKVLATKMIHITKDYKNYIVNFMTPKDKDHEIWIRFIQNRYRETGGSLFIKKLQINNILVDLKL